MRQARSIRLSDSIRVTASDASEWWEGLDKEAKDEYIHEHPNSKYAQQAINEEHENPKKKTAHQQPGSVRRNAISMLVKQDKSKIAHKLKASFPKIALATSALKALAKKDKLEDEHVEVLHELGNKVVHTILSTSGIHASLVHAAADIGTNAVTYAIDKFKEHYDKTPKQDHVETFVEAVGDGLEQARHTDVPEQHKKPGSSYRKAISKHILGQSKHIANVLHKTYPEIKHAVGGLSNIAKGEKLDGEQKKAVKGLCKTALKLSIAALPGGIAAHIGAGVGVAAVNYGIKHFKHKKLGEEKPESLIHHLVESIGEGISEAVTTGEMGELAGGGGE